MALGILIAVFFLFPDSASHGQVSGLTPDQLQQLQQLQQQGALPTGIGAGAVNPNAVPPPQPTTILQPAVPAAPMAQQPSRLEQIMSQRAGTPLDQFGYEQLGIGHPVAVPQTGAVQDDYVLGAGDEIYVSLRGQENNELRATVDRNGQIVLPRLSPLPAAGRTFGSFREDLRAAVQRSYVATTASVSVGRVRQISVQISGEVNVPGQRLLTGLNSAVDAIILAGGIKKTGSLRNVRVQRAGRDFVLDLYSILTQGGGASRMRLADGDRIIVPPLGPTVAVTGLVRQPGIYELLPGQRSMSVASLLALAGGQEVRGLYRLSVMRVAPDGRTNLVELKGQTGTIDDSEILFVQFGANQTVNRATLAGGTRLAGSFPITPGTKLSEILKAPGALGENPYTLFGVISRRDPRSYLRTLIAFTPAAVLNDREEMVLASDDIIRVISMPEMRLLMTAVRDFSAQEIAQKDAMRNPYARLPNNGAATNVATDTNAVGNVLLANADANSSNRAAVSQEDAVRGVATRVVPGSNGVVPADRDGPAQNFQDVSAPAGSAPARREGVSINRDVETLGQMAEQLSVDALVLTNFLRDHQATVNGAVHGPGTFFVGPSVVLQDLITAAGSTLNWADVSNVEAISTVVDPTSGRSLTQVNQLPLNPTMLASYLVKPHDEFRLNEVFNDADVGSVTIQGEVRFSGNFKLTRGERLSDLLSRAGGLTNIAYPYGTIFLRKSVAAQEQQAFVRAANEASDQLMVAMTRVGSGKIDPSTFASMQTFVNDLRNQKALGRIAVQADPSLLASRPNQDPILESGDVIYVPPRPATVAVLGQVMQPGSFPYTPNATIRDYLERAGGYRQFADESDTFVVLPDGSARRVEKSWLRFDPVSLPPGSAIVVPRDMTPLDLRQTVIDVTQILSQLAVSIASVAVLSKQ